ncbi:MAG: 16S rRNA (uracil(1498)-N(3))-methyltransferase [Nitrospiraceae bacterium]|nr:16S rRNA (uracil(1498)-N(3))-methyltransferase [Nitrospiraceae bacterium]
MTVYVHPDEISKKHGILLSAEKSRYLVTVLRSKEGDEINVIDGRGRAYRACIASASKKNVSINIIEEVFPQNESSIKIVLCQGMLKGEKMDMVIQKAVELGASAVIPLVTERTIPRHTAKISRWQKIAEEAAEQCGRAVVPDIKEPAEYKDFLEGLTNYCGIIFWEQGGIKLSEALKRTVPGSRGRCESLYVVVGPEGGLSEHEVSVAEAAGFIRVSLGKRILRAETAAIVAVAAVGLMIDDIEAQACSS